MGGKRIFDSPFVPATELKSSSKPFDISKWEAWEVWEKVKANKGASGVDGVTLAEFEKDLKNNLFKI